MADEVNNTKEVAPKESDNLSTVPPETSQITDSNIKGVSIRGILALLITLTLCSMTLLKFDIKEPFYSIAVFTIGFYFGQKQLKGN